MACNPDELMEEAKCLACAIPEGVSPFVVLELWCQLINGGGI